MRVSLIFGRIVTAVKRYFAHQQKLRDVQLLERRIDRACAEYRYPIADRLRQIGLQLHNTSNLDTTVVLQYFPEQRLVKLHNRAHSNDCRMALAMFLCYLAITEEAVDCRRVPPYVVHQTDLDSPDGPYENAKWVDYMRALDLVFPIESYRMIRSRFAPEQQNYVFQRVLDVSPATVELRHRHFANNTHPLSGFSQYTRTSSTKVH